ncbi:hypothetical protein EVAR_18350_1 [Eumeta japonica]|uniref:Uncharacterized protein n=1 Tax=Eumeta variegata TaxID=151549 RepID=A0A4C1VB86_EUMVA|nr:hypothetical protein EVAR_18350_1 [Eumeta japonica]
MAPYSDCASVEDSRVQRLHKKKDCRRMYLGSRHFPLSFPSPSSNSLLELHILPLHRISHSYPRDGQSLIIPLVLRISVGGADHLLPGTFAPPK